MPYLTKCCICRNVVPPERVADKKKKADRDGVTHIYCGYDCSSFKRSNESVEAASRRWFIRKKEHSVIDRFIYGYSS